MKDREIPQFLIAAPASGSGKTTIARGLMGLFTGKGYRVQAFKCGPDYIDPCFHTTICNGRPSVNLDPFMASVTHLHQLYAHYSADADICITEGMMGMFDGYDGPRGSSAEIARLFRIPVVLVVEACGACAYSIAALIHGFCTFDTRVQVAGVIFNRVKSGRHAERLKETCASIGVECFGFLYDDETLKAESRHLGLKIELSDQKQLRKATIGAVGNGQVELDKLLKACTRPRPFIPDNGQERSEARERTEIKSEVETRDIPGVKLKPEMKDKSKTKEWNIVIGRNNGSFSFIYEEHLHILHRLGNVTCIDPERDAWPDGSVDLLYLPGGYPESHLEQLCENTGLMEAIRLYAEGGGRILAECGGMMYLGKRMQEQVSGSQLKQYSMTGIFPFYIDLNERYLTLGYRQCQYRGQSLRGHEFHYTHLQFDEGAEQPASAVQMYNAKGLPVDTALFRYKNVIASYTHLYWGEADICKLFDDE